MERNHSAGAAAEVEPEPEPGSLAAEWAAVSRTLGHNDRMVRRAFYYGVLAGQTVSMSQADLWREVRAFLDDVRAGRA